MSVSYTHLGRKAQIGNEQDALAAKERILRTSFSVRSAKAGEKLRKMCIRDRWLLVCLLKKQDQTQRAAPWRSLGIGAGLAVLAAAALIVPFSVNQSPGWLIGLYKDCLLYTSCHP